MFCICQVKVAVFLESWQLCCIGSREDTVQQVLGNEALTEEFLDICEYYDAHILPEGPETRQRAGLIAIAERE